MPSTERREPPAGWGMQAVFLRDPEGQPVQSVRRTNRVEATMTHCFSWGMSATGVYTTLVPAACHQSYRLSRPWVCCGACSVERQIGDDSLQPVVLILELLQSSYLGRKQTVVFLLPVEVGRLTDTGLPADVGHGVPSAPCFRMNAFWASENRDAFMALRPSQPGNRRRRL